jgi:putative Ca2+/H+ antiporter (TMEM165/GDT1 family)
MSLSLFLACYAMVFIAELVGDKALYTISALATRYRPAHIFTGITLAFMGKMLAAVLVGRAIAELPAALVASLSAATFFTMALVIWLKKPEEPTGMPEPAARWSKAVLVAFAAIFFSEWGDIGQITAATLAASYRQPLVVWLAATLAMMSKGAVAITVGVGLRRYVPARALRYGAFGLCLTMGVLAALRIAV